MLRRLRRGQTGQTSAEYLGVLVIVSVLIAALFVANPGVGETVSTSIRTTLCRIAGAACEGGAGGTSGTSNPEGGADEGGENQGAPEGGGDDGADPQGVADGGDGDDGSWLDRLGPFGTGLRETGEFFQGAGAQVWDEVKGLGDTAVWIWDTVTSPEQRRENGEIWEAIKDDPGAALSAIWDGIWDPIQQEWNQGREAAAVGRGAAAIVTTIFGGKGLTRLRNLRPDLDDIARRTDDVPARRPDIACAPNSFLASTLVLLADGTTLPIAEVDIGEQVLAADPLTGEVSARPVTNLIAGTGAKQLTEVSVAGATLTATDEHPFYLPATGTWVDAEDLRPGHLLLTPTGTRVPVQAVTGRTATTTVHNLTIADLHTYYVLAGPHPLLVHNAAPCPPGPNTSGPPGYDWGPPTGTRRLPNRPPFDNPDVVAGINATLDRIEAGGPFPHPDRDGTVYQNDGRRGSALLSARPSNYYYEYTVDTPGLNGRGERRIVIGRQGEVYYSNHHYEDFQRIDPRRRPP